MINPKRKPLLATTYGIANIPAPTMVPTNVAIARRVLCLDKKPFSAEPLFVNIERNQVIEIYNGFGVHWTSTRQLSVLFNSLKFGSLKLFCLSTPAVVNLG